MRRDSFDASTIAAVLATAALVVNVVGALSLHAALTQGKPTPPVVYEKVRDADVEWPIAIHIPAINIRAPIIPVGLRSDGLMDIPERADEVGWFSLGFLPGETGNAVLAGHLDSIDGKPGIFWNLRQLQDGDEVIVEYPGGMQKKFRVVHQETYPMDQAPMEEIFGTSTGARLNLITCNGLWQQSLQTYNRRLVVYTEAI